MFIYTCFVTTSAGRLRPGEGAHRGAAGGNQRGHPVLHVAGADKRAALRRTNRRLVPGLLDVRGGCSYVSFFHQQLIVCGTRCWLYYYPSTAGS